MPPWDAKGRLRMFLGFTILFSLFALLTFMTSPSENYDGVKVEAETDTKETQLVIVTRIIDGDTLAIGDDRVRLLGVDAPEKGRCFYEEASAELARLSLGQSVVLEADPLNSDTDEYGRLLRYVRLPDETTSVNADLLKTGFAKHLSWFPISRNAEFASLQGEARQAGLGLWAACA